MKKLFKWSSTHVSQLIALFFLAFIPLYPKLPLLDIVQTWVYVRLEDLLVAIAVLGVSIWAIRKRKWKILKTPLTLPIALFWVVGFISLVISVVFIGPKLQSFYPHLAVLHYVRRIEYMVLFFVAFLALSEDRNALKRVVIVLSVTTLLVAVYGIGQKFLGFPAFLTMNEEFAKGVPLRLPPTARIPSTFAGHYDLAAYLVLVIPIIGSFIFACKKLWQKLAFLGLGVLSYALLLFTESRISFGVYLVSVVTMLIWNKKKWLIIPVVLCSFFLMNFISGTSERFYKTFRFSDVIVDLSTGKPVGTLEKVDGTNAVVQEAESPAEEELPTGTTFIGLPGSEEPPEETTQIETIELYSSKSLATGSGEVATVSGSFLIQKAFVYDISITTRFQGQWPRAIEAFRRNILTGSGYSTLSVAVDGNYHRILGEVGLLGAFSFFGILLYAFSHFLAVKKKLPSLERAFVIGVFSGIVGLLFNALLIDVFEASKVAFTLWILLGFAMAILAKHKPPHSYLETFWNVLVHKLAFVVYLLLFVLFIYSGALKMYFLGDDFTWLRWAVEASPATMYDYLFASNDFFFRPIPKLWYYVMYAFFWLKSGSYHFMSIVLFSAIVIAIFGIAHKAKVHPVLRWISALLFASLSIHHENVYWISGQSSLLAGSMFFTSMFLYMHAWEKKHLASWVYQSLAFTLLIGAMGSYEGMIMAPVAIAIVGIMLYKKRFVPAALMLLAPAYWMLRSYSGALSPAGDYNINLTTLPINSLVNSITYTLSIIVGPRGIEIAESMREMFRLYKSSLIPVSGALLMIVLGIVVYARKKVSNHADALIWLLLSIVVMLPYIGLGGVAERYALVPSGFLVVFLAVVVSKLIKNTLWSKTAAGLVLVLFGLFWWNVSELHRVEQDWQKASDIVEQNLLAVRKNYFPLTFDIGFVFIDVPIRYGRAWVLPTGMEDALWHMFRRNPYSFKVYLVHDIETAHSAPIEPLHNREVLLFGEDYMLERSIKTIETREIPL